MGAAAHKAVDLDALLIGLACLACSHPTLYVGVVAEANVLSGLVKHRDAKHPGKGRNVCLQGIQVSGIWNIEMHATSMAVSTSPISVLGFAIVSDQGIGNDLQ